MREINNISITFDWDGVITNSVQSILDYYEIKNVNYYDIKKWNLSDIIPDITEEDVFKLFDSKFMYSDTTQFIKDIDSDGNEYNVKDLIEELICDKNDIFINSKGTMKNETLKMKFIRNRMLFFNINNLTVTEHAIENKKDVNTDIFIDDKYSNLISATAKVKICFSMNGVENEWNKGSFDKNNNIIIAKSVYELRKIIYDNIRKLKGIKL